MIEARERCHLKFSRLAEAQNLHELQNKFIGSPTSVKMTGNYFFIRKSFVF
jgi:hypothetical protein